MHVKRFFLWVDDIRVPPQGWIHLKSVNETIQFIEDHKDDINLISLDHDAGEYASQGGDYINILNYMEEHNISCRVHVHTMNCVGRERMMTIIMRNN